MNQNDTDQRPRKKLRTQSPERELHSNGRGSTLDLQIDKHISLNRSQILADSSVFHNASRSIIQRNQEHNVSEDIHAGPSHIPTNGHFQNSSNVLVNGGHFLNTLGHHANITINLNQYDPSKAEGNATEEALHIDTSKSGRRDTNPEMRFKEEPHDEKSDSKLLSQAVTPSPTSNEIYERYLLLKCRGFPLWIPEPSKNLPLSYQRQGVSIGDVGIITSSGGFSYLFNACVPRNHPINPPDMPDEFSPIYPPISPLDIRRIVEFKSGSHVASSGFRKVQVDYNSSDLIFESADVAGALLAMPEGAISEDVENISKIRSYIATNIESWYRYANGPRGREVKNGDIRFIIGCDKSTSWGIAAVSNILENITKLKLVERKPTKSNAMFSSYVWEYSGRADVRAGPGAEEIEELKANDFSVDHQFPEMKYTNQCLFIRTLNPMLSDELWGKINHDLGSSDVQDATTGTDSNDPLTSSTEGHFSSYVNSRGNATNTHGSGQTGNTRSKSIISFTSQIPGFKDVRISMTPSIPPLIFHPSTNLNIKVLQMVSGAKMAITQDSDWFSWFQQDETTVTSSEQIVYPALDTYEVRNEDGVLYLHSSTSRGDSEQANEGNQSTNSMDQDSDENEYRIKPHRRFSSPFKVKDVESLLEELKFEYNGRSVGDGLDFKPHSSVDTMDEKSKLSTDFVSHSQNNVHLSRVNKRSKSYDSLDDFGSSTEEEE